MTEELAKKWANLSLTEEEDCVEPHVCKDELEVGNTLGKTCVVGKLIADHMVSKETIRNDMMRWWKPSGNVSFKILGENLFLIEFTELRDKERVLEGRPWNFDGCLLLIEDFDGSAQPSDLAFNQVAFWVRMVNLPLACMSKGIGRKIGESVGTVEAVDTEANGMGWGEFLRVKIRIDLHKPLPRGRKINVEGKQLWIYFQYEKLPKFCFQCGLISHGKTGCMKKNIFRHHDANPQYGPWMRVASPTRKADRNHGRNPAKRWYEDSEPEERHSQSVRTRRDRRRVKGRNVAETDAGDGGDDDVNSKDEETFQKQAGSCDSRGGKDKRYSDGSKSEMGGGSSGTVDGGAGTPKERAPHNNYFPSREDSPVTKRGGGDMGVDGGKDSAKNINADLGMKGIAETEADFSEPLNHTQSKQNIEENQGDYDAGGYGEHLKESMHGSQVEGNGEIKTRRGVNGDLNRADWTSSTNKSRQGYFCPAFTLADVEKQMKGVNGREGSTRRRASDSITWKRKAELGETVIQGNRHVELRGKRKKGDYKNEDEENSKRGKTKGRQLPTSTGTGSQEKTIGSGMAAAGSQPRRPQ